MKRLVPGLKHVLYVWVIPLTLSCSLAPDYSRPPTPESPAEGYVHDPEAGAVAVPGEAWWTGLGWPELKELVEESVRANPDLGVAGARVLEARAILRKNSAPLFPFAAGQVSAERSELAGIETDLLQVGLNLSYEPDIWGRIRNTREASLQDLMATEEDRLTVYHNLVADVVRNYTGFVFSERQRLLALKTVETNRQSLALVEFRYGAGLVPALDVFLARQNLAASEARVPFFSGEVSRARHRLNILMGRYPASDLALPENLSPDVPGLIPAGLPSELLRRRPDLRASESRIMAANARVGVARAGLFPRLALTASGGYRSQELGDLFLKKNELWTLAANLAGPVFEAGRNRAEVEASRARLQAAARAYVKAVLQALAEVEDALASEQTLRGRREALVRSVYEAEQSFSSSRGRYSRGLDSLIPTLNSERALYVAQVELIENERNLFLNRVALHLALGGDWEHERNLAGLESSESNGDGDP